MKKSDLESRIRTWSFVSGEDYVWVEEEEVAVVPEKASRTPAQLGDLTQESSNSLAALLGTRMHNPCPAGAPEARAQRLQPLGSENGVNPRSWTSTMCSQAPTQIRRDRGLLLNLLILSLFEYFLSGTWICTSLGLEDRSVGQDEGPSRVRKAVGPCGLGRQTWEILFV